MPFDPNRLLAMPPIVTRQHLDRNDVILYALGVGAEELRFLYESDLLALPTMAVTMANPGFFWPDPQFDVDWRKILHGETDVVFHSALPVEGELVGSTVFGPVFDKGLDKGTVVYNTREVRLADGTPVATIRNASFLRGDGGQGGSPEPQPAPHTVPDRAPDIVRFLSTTETQALLYRLSGDMNPLHADPVVAAQGGFPRPILHGLCTFGVAGRTLLAALCDNEPSRMKRIKVRFARPVFPGETIRTSVWEEAPGRAAFRASVVERDIVVLDNGLVEYT